MSTDLLIVAYVSVGFCSAAINFLRSYTSSLGAFFALLMFWPIFFVRSVCRGALEVWSE